MTLKGSSSKETDFIINEVFLFVLGFFVDVAEIT